VAPPSATPVCSGPEVPLPAVCGAKLPNPAISCRVPADVAGDLRQPNFNVRQRASDLFSWQAFIGINWPALPGSRGIPDAKAPITKPGPRVWETWKETSEVFRQKDGQPVPPAAWNTPEPIPAACGGATKVLVRDEKVDDELDATVQPTYADGSLPGTLTDQSGRRVRYEIRMNKVAFDYVVARKLWDGNVQNAVSEVDFPPTAQIVKAAWREVTAADANRFETTEACICEDGPGGSLKDCRRQRVGLAGFHIMTKTASAPQWIWSTFEQVDNVASLHGAPASFHNPACKGCAVNRQSEPGFPNQVARITPIPAHDPDCNAPGEAVDNIARLNKDLQAALARTGSVLWRYELVSTQWPFQAGGAGSQPETVFEVRPKLLANSTLETYIQESSSCMGCHSVAATNRTSQYVSADFSFTLNNAYPNPNTSPTDPEPDRVPRDPDAIAPPSKPLTSWDRAQWNTIRAGYELAVNTYEMEPAHVGSKLHCGSCHLSAGGDPSASWWVGMMAKYEYPRTTKLQARINQCFSRSLNGSNICDPSAPSGPASCAENPGMNALITYMQWLDEQYQGAHSGEKPANGFPPLPPPADNTASVPRGRSVFQQKCAYCHGAEGQGRYGSGVYYRPALWGPHSYNADAGMGKVSTFAAFLHANMPYGYGGALTVQEAWDVACFVDAQPRPGKGAGKAAAGVACVQAGKAQP
jgi:cytochrome c